MEERGYLKEVRNRIDFKRTLSKLQNTQILVGIPSDQTHRNEGIDNASLLYLLEKGSPQHNLPARPVLNPGIEHARPTIEKGMANIVAATTLGDDNKAMMEMEKVGMAAVNSIKRMFGSEDLAPNAPSTIAAKGSDKPLIDTGLLRRSIQYIIRGKK